jgi:uncharacterized coiled-coil protein SlyX
MIFKNKTRKAIAEKDAKIAELNAALDNRDTQISNLNKLVNTNYNVAPAFWASCEQDEVDLYSRVAVQSRLLGELQSTVAAYIRDNIEYSTVTHPISDHPFRGCKQYRATINLVKLPFRVKSEPDKLLNPAPEGKTRRELQNQLAYLKHELADCNKKLSFYHIWYYIFLSALILNLLIITL